MSQRPQASPFRVLETGRMFYLGKVNEGAVQYCIDVTRERGGHPRELWMRQDMADELDAEEVGGLKVVPAESVPPGALYVTCGKGGA